MEFLENLYEIDNFGIYLFVIIGILVVLFLVVLFFGRKDQKSRTLKQQPVEPILPPEQPKEEVAFKETTVPQAVEIPVVNEVPNVEIPAPFTIETPSVSSPNVVLNSNFMEEEYPQEPSMPIEKEFDFDALADAISKELETIDNHTEQFAKEVVPEFKEEFPKVEEDNFKIFEPIKIEPSNDIVEPIQSKIEIPKETTPEEVKPRPVMPTVFSSVYVNREKEEVKPQVESTPIPVEAKQPEIVAPIKPTIDLPKMVDLPKKVITPEEVKPVIEEPKDNNIFPGLS